MANLTREEREARAAAREAEAETATVEEGVRIEVLERRLQNPHGVPSSEIRLKNKRMFPRWFNSSLVHDRFWTAQNQGWSGVKPDDIIDLKQIGNYGRSPDGWVTRGERGQEVLMCMPREYWDKLQLAKTKKNLELMRDVRGEQGRALEAASKQYGDEFATQMRGVTQKMEIKDSYERVERTGEVE